MSATDLEEPKTIWFDGPCPFLLCDESEGHSHSVCPECGAARHGNLSCATCKTFCESGKPR